MSDITALVSAAQALALGRAAVRADFKLETTDEDEKTFVRMYNTRWNAFAQPLAGLLSGFLSACYRADNHSAEELTAEPGLSITADIVNAWRKITTEVYPSFVSDYSGMTAKIFSNPEAEADLNGPAKKAARIKQTSAFNKIQEQVVIKSQLIEDFIMYQVQLRFDVFRDKAKGMELSRLLRQGQTPLPPAEQPGTQPVARTQVYKPNEAFLEGRHKKYPWYTVQSTGISCEEQAVLIDYIDSGGNFSDMKVPVKYVKRLLDYETLRMFLPALDAAVEKGAEHTSQTIVSTLNTLLVNRMPARGRLTRFFQRNKLINQMGDMGENMVTYSETLMRELQESGWEDMTTMEAGVIIWLTDLTAANPYQVRLSEKIHESWDQAIAQNKTFGIMDCIKVGLTHWAKVRETQATISGTLPGLGGQPKGKEVSDPTLSPKKKKRKKNKKKADGKPEDGVAAAVTTGKTDAKPPATAVTGGQRPPTPQYCFKCGEGDHTARGCKVQPPYKCDIHMDSTSHMTRACNKWRQEQGLVVHPWLLKQGTANVVTPEAGGEIFTGHPDDSLEVLSEEDGGPNQPGPSHHACHVRVSGFTFSDSEDEVPDGHEVLKPKKRMPKAPVQPLLRSSKYGRRRARDNPTGVCHGRIHLTEYSMSSTEFASSAADGKTNIPTYNLLMAAKVPTKSKSEALSPITVLLDTGPRCL